MGGPEVADVISISELRVKTHIGVTPEEQAELQEVVVDITLEADLRTPGRSDALRDTVDYARATRLVADVIESSKANLLEHLADEVAAALLGLEGVRAVTVEIAKDPPPVGENVRNIAIRIERP